MSVHVTSWVLKNSEEAVPGRRLVLLVLADKADDDGGKAFPSVATIAKESRLSERGVRYALRELEKAGRLKAGDPHPMYRTTEYTVVMSEKAAVADPGTECPPGDGGNVKQDGGQMATRTDVTDCPLSILTTSTPNPPTGKRAREDAIPDGFPDDLRPHARAVTLVLREVALERDANAVTIRAVGRAVMDNAHKPLVRTAMELRAWLLDGAGRTRPCTDVVRRYRDWLRKEPDLAGRERLADDGTPAQAQHPPGVVPLNGRRQSRGERQGETIRTLLRSAGEIP